MTLSRNTIFSSADNLVMTDACTSRWIDRLASSADLSISAALNRASVASRNYQSK